MSSCSKGAPSQQNGPELEEGYEEDRRRKDLGPTNEWIAEV